MLVTVWQALRACIVASTHALRVALCNAMLGQRKPRVPL